MVSSEVHYDRLVSPTGVKREGVRISPDFYKAVVLHLVKNYLHVLEPSPPLILAVQGRQGEGKTFQTMEICSQIGVYVYQLSAASMSGMHEKDALEPIREAYVYSSGFLKKKKGEENEKAMIALVIDDFDLSIASKFDRSSYTVNTQLLLSLLMELADKPTQGAGQKTLRIPIIVTGNNFTQLHAPLTRHGRMNFFVWDPSPQEKFEIVRSMFDTILTPESISRLVWEHPDQPISFFAALKNDLVDDCIWKTIQHEQEINMPAIEMAVRQLRSERQTMQMFVSLAKKRTTSTARNYLLSSPHGGGQAYREYSFGSIFGKWGKRG